MNVIETRKKGIKEYVASLLVAYLTWYAYRSQCGPKVAQHLEFKGPKLELCLHVDAKAPSHSSCVTKTIRECQGQDDIVCCRREAIYGTVCRLILLPC